MRKLVSELLVSVATLCTVIGADAATVAQKNSAGDYVIENENVSMTFSGGKDFGFKKFVSGGKSLLSDAGSVTQPWQLIYRGPNGENPTLTPRFGEYRGAEIVEYNGAKAIAVSWNMVLSENPEWNVKMIVSLPDDAELPEWNIEASLPEGWVITETEFPRISVTRPAGAKAILPVAYGTEYNVGAEGQLQTRYPSCTGTMQLVMMHTPDGTLYFSPRDTEGAGKIMLVKSEGANVVFIQKVTTNYGWSKDGKFSLPWATVMGYNKDTWQNTALKWYRPWTFTTQWGKKTIAERKIVEWIKNADMWMRPADATAETMDAVRKGLKYYGKGVGLHWYYWHNYQFDTHYPEYFPEKPEFKSMIAEAQKMGAKVTPYINGRLWDPSTKSYKSENASLASCRKPDGTLYTEVYSSKVLNTVTCPASDLWQKKLPELNKHILDSLHTDGVYMDQIGCASSEPCYATNHNHEPGGGDWWPKAYREILTGMREGFYTDTQAMSTEECAEPYLDLFDMMLVVNSPHNSYTTMVPLFPLIYSDRCIYSGYTYVPWKVYDGSLLFMSMRSLLWGSQLGWVNPLHLMADNATREAAFLKNLADFRKKNHDIFVGGRYMGEFIPEGENETVDVPNYQKSPVVLGAEWTTTKGNEVQVVVNMSSTDRKVTLPSGKIINVKAYNAIRINK